MPYRRRFSLAIPILLAGFAFGQSPADEDYHVYTDAPRLLLTKQRLRLLQRERERHSMRWAQFDSLISGGAPMPEPGFAWGFVLSGRQGSAAGKRAIEWALNADAQRDLRQLALVFDWCGAADDQDAGGQDWREDRARNRRYRSAKAAAKDPAKEMAAQNARTLAAIAIADRLPDHGEAILSDVIQHWWRGEVVKRIKAGKPAAPREQLYAMYEMMHAIRDNLKIDLRESAPDVFQDAPDRSFGGSLSAGAFDA